MAEINHEPEKVMKVLVLNCGSSSVKFRFFEMDTEMVLAEGLIEQIGYRDSRLIFKTKEKQKQFKIHFIKDHSEAIDLVLKTLGEPEQNIIRSIEEIHAVGHRVVHGGEAFTESVSINETVFEDIKKCAHFAPLHNPPNIKGIMASLWHIPFARQVAVFDTAFHQSMEPEGYMYALPWEWYEQWGIRRYGFHGTSHRYVAQKAGQLLGKPIEDLKMITCHLGNGVSVTAIKEGKSVETSMGFTPLEGLIMGTRCGNIDSAIPIHMMEVEKMSPEQMNVILNKKSGLTGITCGDSDMRIIEKMAANGSEQHQLALKMFTKSVKKYIGSYAAMMGGIDVVVFTAGIGENSPAVRRMSCEGLAFLGIEIDENRNKKNEISIGRGKTAVLVIPTNEELAIAREVISVLDESVLEYQSEVQ